MIHEQATILVRSGSEVDFEAAVVEATPLFRAQGALSLQLDRSVETPNEYTMTVGWARVEDHTVRFRESQAFLRWRELAGAYFAAAPKVKHLEHVYVGF
jgi:quinol monooxygenase YgiN